MRTKYRYIVFIPGLDSSSWLIFNRKDNERIGWLDYNRRWNEWELVPEKDTGWTKQCLLDVIDFIKQLEEG